MTIRQAWLRDDPRQWRAGTLDREALLADAAALARRSGFGTRAQAFARNWLRVHAAHPALRAVLRNTPRYLLLVVTLVLHHRHGRSAERDGITPGQIAAFFDAHLHGVLRTSLTQVKAMLAHARLQGLLHPAPHPGSDARLRPLVPTPLLDGLLRHWVAAFLEAADGDPAFPLPAPPSAMVAVPGLVAEVFSYRLSALSEDRFALIDAVPTLGWVLRHDYGYRAFLLMVDAAQPQPDGTMLVPLTHSELARRAGVARGTVRQLVADAASQGWLHANTPPVGWRWSAEAAHTTLLWIALELLWMHALACAAWVHCTPSSRPA